MRNFEAHYGTRFEAYRALRIEIVEITRRFQPIPWCFRTIAAISRNTVFPVGSRRSGAPDFVGDVHWLMRTVLPETNPSGEAVRNTSIRRFCVRFDSAVYVLSEGVGWENLQSEGDRPFGIHITLSLEGLAPYKEDGLGMRS